MASLAPKNYTASATLTTSDAECDVTVNAAAGLTLTLPPTTGTGYNFKIILGTTVTSNNVIVSRNTAADIMIGMATQAGAASGSAPLTWKPGATDNTITLNGTTKGGIKGDVILLTDISAGVWAVQVLGQASGTQVTPFSVV